MFHKALCNIALILYTVHSLIHYVLLVNLNLFYMDFCHAYTPFYLYHRFFLHTVPVRPTAYIATLLLYGSVSLKQVQGRLGRRDIKTTNKYLHCLA